MRTKILLAMGLCAAIGLLATQTCAAEHEHKEGETHGKVKVPDTLEGIWKEIHHHHQELKDTVKATKLAEVHEHAFAIRDLGKALPANAETERTQNCRFRIGSSSGGFSSKDSLKNLLPSSPS